MSSRKDLIGKRLKVKKKEGLGRFQQCLIGTHDNTFRLNAQELGDVIIQFEWRKNENVGNTRWSFDGQLMSGEKLRGYLSFDKGKESWIEYYDEEAENERDLLLMVLGSTINGWSKYLVTHNSRYTKNIMVVNTDDINLEKEGFDRLYLVMESLRDLNVNFETETLVNRGDRTKADTITLKSIDPCSVLL